MNDQAMRAIAIAREPVPDDHAVAAGKFSALAIVLADMLEAALGRESARLRDLEYPDFVPESVTDAAFASQADWYKPGDGDGHAVVLVPQLIESVAEAAYRATLKHLKEES